MKLNITEEFIEKSLILAENSPRKRVVKILHEDNYKMQMLINCVLNGSIIIPHKHEKPDKTEVFHILRGSIKLQEFNKDGKIIKSEILEEGDIGFTPPRTYHNLEVISDYALLFICINGKYNPKTHHQELKSWKNINATIVEKN